MIAARTSRARGGAIVLAVLATWAPCGTPWVYAQTPAATIAVRSGNHADFGRVVIDTNGKAPFSLDQDGDHLIVRLTGEAAFGPSPALPRNVVAMKTDGPALDVMLRHGAKCTLLADGRPDRAGCAGRRLRTAGCRNAAGSVIDHYAIGRDAGHGGADERDAGRHSADTQAGGAAATTACRWRVSPELGGRTAVREPLPVQAQPLAPPQAASKPAPPSQAAIVVETTQQLPPGRDVLPENNLPIGLRARRTRLPKEMDGTAFLVPFDASTGAAAFRSGDSTYVVFDERRPVDMAGFEGTIRCSARRRCDCCRPARWCGVPQRPGCRSR